MLSEPRSKVKWSLNPRGNDWASDDFKYGQRMLEKMGWTKGKGLGKNEDGNPNHISVVNKQNVKGLGYKGYDGVWIEHQQDFDSLLADLNKNPVSDSIDSTQLKSLEEKSKISKKRIHRYHKVIKGKDLSKRTVEDLQCIFGKKDSKNLAEKIEENNSISSESSSRFNFSCTNTKDYFKEKFNKSQQNEFPVQTEKQDLTVSFHGMETMQLKNSDQLDNTTEKKKQKDNVESLNENDLRLNNSISEDNIEDKLSSCESDKSRNKNKRKYKEKSEVLPIEVANPDTLSAEIIGKTKRRIDEKENAESTNFLLTEDSRKSDKVLEKSKKKKSKRKPDEELLHQSIGDASNNFCKSEIKEERAFDKKDNKFTEDVNVTENKKEKSKKRVSENLNGEVEKKKRKVSFCLNEIEKNEQDEMIVENNDCYNFQKENETVKAKDFKKKKEKTLDKPEETSFSDEIDEEEETDELRILRPSCTDQWTKDGFKKKVQIDLTSEESLSTIIDSLKRDEPFKNSNFTKIEGYFPDLIEQTYFSQQYRF